MAAINSALHARVAALQHYLPATHLMQSVPPLFSSATSGQLESHTGFACTALDRHICASPLPYHPWHTPGAGGRDEQCPPRPRGRPAALLTSDASHAVSVSSARSPSAPSVARAAKAGAPAPGLPLSNHWYGSSPTTGCADASAPRVLSRSWKGRGATPSLSLTLRPGARHVAVPLLWLRISRLTQAFALCALIPTIFCDICLHFMFQMSRDIQRYLEISQ